MNRNFTTAIVGLGLIGGSLAYALKDFKNGTRIGYDIDDKVCRRALENGAIDMAAHSLSEAVHNADLVVFCSSPGSIMRNMEQCFAYLKPGVLVTEICGVKKQIVEFVETHLPKDADYVGLHPMAGKEVSGFENADKDLFCGAGFIIVPPMHHLESSVELLRELSYYVGAKRIVVNDAKTHDSLIAYSSDLMHIAAASLCREYPEGFSMAHAAGAFRDCTRVATLDAPLWTELLLDNAQNILPHIDILIQNLSDIKCALQDADSNFLCDYLRIASSNKEKMLAL